ncbi:membrane protein YqjD [Klebsiella variicola]|nr:membrane protein YqjD [Klebsiella variicola]
MAKENVTDDLRAELKTLADTLEEVLNSSADKSKEEIVNCVVKQRAR